VVVFATDAQAWTWASGRVRVAGSNLDGGADDRWSDLKTLDGLRANAVPLTLTTGERKTLGLTATR
jgi:hypothetical protein